MKVIKYYILKTFIFIFIINVFTIRLDKFNIFNIKLSIIFIDLYLLYCSEVIVGSSKGSIFHYDFRGRTKFPVKIFRGSTGSVKAVSYIHYLNQIHLMSISLDSHIRIHNFNSGDLSYKVI